MFITVLSRSEFPKSAIGYIKLARMSNEDWDTLDDAMANKLSITDVSFVSDKKKAPRDYDVVSSSHTH